MGIEHYSRDPPFPGPFLRILGPPLILFSGQAKKRNEREMPPLTGQGAYLEGQGADGDSFPSHGIKALMVGRCQGGEKIFIDKSA